jgi:predicted RNA-binding protein
LEERLLLSAVVSTDKSDYAPNSTAVITGSGFSAGETVALQVARTDGSNSSDPDYRPWYVTDGGAGDLDGKADGHIETTWYVDEGELGASLSLTATGLSSGEVATSYFTDAANLSASISTTSVTYGNSTTFTLTITNLNGGGNSLGSVTVAVPTQFTLTSGITVAATDPGGYSRTWTTTDSTSTLIKARRTGSGTNSLDTNGTLVLTFTATAKGVGSGSAVWTTAGFRGTNYATTPFNAPVSQPTVAVNKRALTVSATGTNRIYDGTTADVVTLSDNRISGDVLTTGYSAATFANKNVGIGKTVSVSGISISGAAAANYTVNTTATTTASISARTLTGSITAGNKVYDGTAAASITSQTLAGVISGDTVSYTGGTATFSDRNAGTAKTVTATGLGLSGADAGNYLVNATASTTANITARTLTVSATGTNKVYDGTTADAVTLSDNRISGDVLTVGYAAAEFADKNVGIGKSVSVSGITVTGADSANYTFNTTALTSADIGVLAVTGSITAASKTYDGTTAATITDRSLAGIIAGDDVSYVGGTASFDTKNVGAGKTVTVTGLGLYGADAGNYVVNSTATTTAEITPASLIGSITADNKVYDGTTAATITGRNLAGVLAGDDVDYVGGTAVFDSKNVGTGKLVSASGLNLSGAEAGNYVVNTTAETTANVSALLVTGTITAASKTYDGTTAVTIASRTLTGVIAGDDVAYFGGSADFDTRNAGVDKSVNATGLFLIGADAGNYVVNTIASTSADIDPLALVGTITASGKVYDGTTAATITNRSLSGVIDGDNVNYIGGVADFDNKNVAAGKTVTAVNLWLDGADAGNYTVNTTAETTADITPRQLTVTAAGQNKIYDGTTAATVTLADDRIAGDSFTDSYAAASFADKNVGTGKPVSVSGIAITGADAGNYTVNTSADTTADITPRQLTVTAFGQNRIYDGTTAATVTLADDRVTGDLLTTGYGTASFADKNVGTGKTVSVTGITITGTDADNYTVNTTADTTADITPRQLTVSATGQNKIYDGTAAATVTLADDRIAGDSFTDSYAAASFADKNVGTGKPVSVSGITITGTDAGNYTVNTSGDTTADIAPRQLTVSAIGQNKVYDGTTAATVTLTDNRVAGDVLTTGYSTANFADKNVGAGKTVSVSGITVTGADSGNYTFNTTTSTSANITARALTVSAAGQNKIYDGTTADTVTLADNRVSGDLLTIGYGTANFADKNVGVGKTVSVSGITVTGADSGNYTFNTTASTSANITARALTVTVAGQNKVYDGTTAATVTLADDRVAGDLLTTGYSTASFANKNVGAGKTVTVSGITVTGADSGNYTFNTTASTSANITARALTVTVAGQNKVYDGTTAATVTLADNRISGDLLTTGYGAANFANKNVGVGITVSVSGITVTGADSGNYTFNTTANTSANITARALTVSAIGQNKVYDGTTAATVTLADNRISGDLLTTGYSTANFADKNVGVGKTVSVSGITVTGTDSGNYTFNSTASTSANITARALTVSAIGQNKVYDGTTAATVTLSDNRVSGDLLTTGYSTASFANKNVGAGKTVTVSGITVTGADSGNYTFNTTASTSANITARAISGSVTAADKVYDGTTAATLVSRTLSGVLAGDTVTYTGGTATFDTRNVGTGKTVTATGLGLSGADAGNYSVNSGAGTIAKITARSITISANAQSRIYGSPDPALTWHLTSGALAAGDSVSGSLTRVAGESVGTYAIQQGTLSVSSNYNLTFIGSTLTINPLGSDFNLSGPWLANGKIARINQTGTALVILDETGSGSAGTVIGAGQVTGRGGLTGAVDLSTPDQGRIVWSDGTTWLRISLGGQYYNPANNQLTSIVQNAMQINLTNAAGETATGAFVTPTQLFVPSWNQTANIVDGALEFSNGSSWKKLNLLPNYANAAGDAVHIVQNGTTTLSFVNKLGQTTAGRWISPTQVQAAGWGVTGTVANGQILWSNNCRWLANTTVFGESSGTGTLSITSTDSQILLTNRSGGTSRAAITAAGTLVALDWGNVVGTRSNGRIVWSNGTVWDNFDFNALDAVFSDIRSYPFGGG